MATIVTWVIHIVCHWNYIKVNIEDMFCIDTSCITADVVYHVI